MGLVVPPSSQRAIPRVVPLFTMPWAGAITYKGKAYGIGYPITGVDTMAYWNVWDDPTHLEAYRNLPLVNNGKIFGSTLDVQNQAIYVGPYFTNSPRTARVWKWDLVTEQLTVLVNDVALGIGSPQTGTQSGICNDGTYLYFVYYTQVGTPSWVFKFRISDGTLVSKIQMTATLPVTGSAASGASHIELYDANNLIVAGIVPGWIASVPTDLSTITNTVQTRGDGGGMFGMQMISGGSMPGMWVGDYGEALFYFFDDPTLPSWTTFDYRAQAGPGNGCFDLRFDGFEWLWSAQRDYTILGIDVGTNPASDDPGECEHVFRELTTLPPGPTGSSNWKPGMIWPLNEKEPLLSSAGIAMADSLSGATQTSFGYFVQYGTAKSQPPLVGRGVSGRR